MAQFISQRSQPRRGRAAVAAAVVSCVLVIGAATAAAFGGFGFNPFGTQQVGLTYANGVLLPTNQWISPLGTRILDNQERLVSSTLSPDGTYVAALGWNDFSGYLTIINLKTQTIVDRIGLATPGAPEDDFSVAADGPLFSSDGTTLWVPQSTFLLRFSFDPTTGTATQTAAIPLCGSALTQPQCDPNIGPSNASGAELPSGMAYSPDSLKLYVALNGANKLAVIDNPSATTPNVSSTIPVGNAPRQVVISPTARPLTSPTRVAGRPSPASSRTYPMARRSCRASRLAGE